MAVEIGVLRALLSLDSAAFEQGAKRAQASMSNLQRSLTQASERMRDVGRKMTTRVTLPLAGMATVAVRSSLRTIDAQAKMAQSLDTSVVSLQNLTRAADLAGISQTDLEGSLRRMTRRISLAASGTGPAVDALERLGMTAADFADVPADERVRLITDAIREMIPETEQAGIASQIFGDRTGLAMTRLDAGTIARAADEVERFGVAVADVDADAIEDANDAMSAIGLVTRGLSNQLTVALAPTLQRIAERMADLSHWFAGLSPQVQRFAGIAAAVAAAIGPLAIALGFVATGLAAMASPVGLVIVGLGALAAAVAYVVTNFSEMWLWLQDRLQSALQFGRDLVGSIGDGIREAAGAVGDALRALGDRIVELLSELPARMLDAAKAVGASIIDGIVGGVREREAATGSAVRKATRGAIDAAKDEADIQSPSREFMRIGEQMMAGLGLGIDESAQAAAQRAASAAQEVVDAASMVEAPADAASGAFDSLSRSIGGAIAQQRDLGEAVRQTLRQIASDLISSGLSQAFGALFGGLGGGGAGGGVLASLFGGFRADGGPVMPSRAYVVGERGPELFVPSASGNIVPNGAGGGVEVNIYGAPAEPEVTRQGGRIDIDFRRTLAQTISSGGVDRELRQRRSQGAF